jgi:hypothetical protein
MASCQVEAMKPLRKSNNLPRIWRLVRRVDELELLLARIHHVCSMQLGLRKRQRIGRNRRAHSERRKAEKGGAASA